MGKLRVGMILDRDPCSMRQRFFVKSRSHRHLPRVPPIHGGSSSTRVDALLAASKFDLSSVMPWRTQASFLCAEAHREERAPRDGAPGADSIVSERASCGMLRLMRRLGCKGSQWVKPNMCPVLFCRGLVFSSVPKLFQPILSSCALWREGPVGDRQPEEHA